MFQDIINKQGNCLDVRDDISENYYLSHVFLLIYSLWCLNLRNYSSC